MAIKTYDNGYIYYNKNGKITKELYDPVLHKKMVDKKGLWDIATPQQYASGQNANVARYMSNFIISDANKQKYSDLQPGVAGSVTSRAGDYLLSHPKEMAKYASQYKQKTGNEIVDFNPKADPNNWIADNTVVWKNTQTGEEAVRLTNWPVQKTGQWIQVRKTSEPFTEPTGKSGQLGKDYELISTKGSKSDNMTQKVKYKYIEKTGSLGEKYYEAIAGDITPQADVREISFNDFIKGLKSSYTRMRGRSWDTSSKTQYDVIAKNHPEWLNEKADTGYIINPKTGNIQQEKNYKEEQSLQEKLASGNYINVGTETAPKLIPKGSAAEDNLKKKSNLSDNMATTKLPSGILVRDSSNNKIYFIDNGKKRHITSMDALAGGAFVDIDPSHLADVPDGSPINKKPSFNWKGQGEINRLLKQTGINWQKPRGYQGSTTPTTPTPTIPTPTSTPTTPTTPEPTSKTKEQTIKDLEAKVANGEALTPTDEANWNYATGGKPLPTATNDKPKEYYALSNEAKSAYDSTNSEHKKNSIIKEARDAYSQRNIFNPSAPSWDEYVESKLTPLSTTTEPTTPTPTEQTIKDFDPNDPNNKI